MAQASFVLIASTAAYLTVAIVVAGGRKPGYRHQRDTISELGEYGSAFAGIVSFGVFLPVALALMAAAGLVGAEQPEIAMLALAMAFGYGSAALFPCDPGAPATGSVRNAVHNLGGAVEYLGGTYALLQMSESEVTVFRFAGLLVAACTALLVLPGSLRGVVQRVAETTLFASLLTGLWLIEPSR